MSDDNCWRRRLLTDQQQDTIICQPVYVNLPVYDKRDVCKVLVEENVMTTIIGQEPEQPWCQDFSVNVNMGLDENQFIRKWPYNAELNSRLTDAVCTNLVIILVWLMIGFNQGIANQQSKILELLIIISLYIASAVFGKIISTISHIPPFVGMILVGMVFQSNGIEIKIYDDRHFFWLYFCEFTVTVILILCALELSVWKLHRFSFTVFKLAFLPQIAEILAINVIALNYKCQHSDQFQLVYMSPFNMLGINSILFMPSMSVLKPLGCFDEDNIYTLLHATSSMVNMVAVIINYFSYAKVNQLDISLQNILKKIVIDVMFGILWAIFMIHASPPDCLVVNNELKHDEANDRQVNNKHIFKLLTTTKRVALLLAGGILTSFINLFFGTPWYFSLSCGISSFVAGIGWKWKMREINYNSSSLTFNNNNSEDQNQIRDVIKVFKYIWNALQPLLFGFLGTRFEIQYVEFNMLLIIPVILVFVRILTTATCSVWGSGFNYYEVIFTVFAWLPSSTLMAVLAPLYLGIVEHYNERICVHQLFNISIIYYLVNATLGALFVHRYGLKYGSLITKMTPP